MSGFAGTRAEREWLAVARRIADALERIADQLEKENSPQKEEDDEHDDRSEK